MLLYKSYDAIKFYISKRKLLPFKIYYNELCDARVTKYIHHELANVHFSAGELSSK